MVKQAQYNLRPIFSEVFNDYQSFYKNGCFLDQTTQNASIQNGILVASGTVDNSADFGTTFGFGTNLYEWEFLNCRMFQGELTAQDFMQIHTSEKHLYGLK